MGDAYRAGLTAAKGEMERQSGPDDIADDNAQSYSWRMATKPEWFPTCGLVGGETFQFAEGRWPEEIGAGIALNWDAFDLIEPFLASSCAEWTPMHAYGPLELSPSCLKLMVVALRQPNNQGLPIVAREQQLRSYLASWLDDRLEAGKIVSFLGV